VSAVGRPGRKARTDRRNPVGIGLAGLVLASAGTLALVVSVGAFGFSSDRPVLDGDVLQFVRDESTWVQLGLLVVGVLAVVVGLRWLLVQLRVERLSDVLLEADDARGQTSMSPKALTDAVETEARSVHGVSDASARLENDPVEPDLRLVVDLTARADLREVRTAIETVVLAHAREALSRDDVPTLVQYRLARGSSTRAR